MGNFTIGQYEKMGGQKLIENFIKDEVFAKTLTFQLVLL